MRACRTCFVSYDENLRIGPMRSYCQRCFDDKERGFPRGVRAYYKMREPDVAPYHIQTFHRMSRLVSVDVRLSWVGQILPFRRCTETKLVDLGYRLLERGGSVIDVGANFGELVAHWSPLASRYVAVEPISEYWDLIERNASQNNACVELWKFALSDTESSSKMTWSIAGGDRACIAPNGTINVDTKRLDDVMSGSCTVLKIDAEGHELPILRGAVELLQRCHPHLILEVNPRWTKRYGYGVEDLLNFTRDHGYTDVRSLVGEPYTGQPLDDLWFVGD